MLKFKKEYLIGITVAVLFLLLDILYFWGTRWFYALAIISMSTGWAQFWYDFYKENQRQKTIERKFLEFVRALVSTVRSGIPIPQAIMQVANEDFGDLTPYLRKLAYQLEWGIPIHNALITFANDTGNKVIKRSISIVLEAEQSGGDIEDVLQSVTNSVVDIRKMKAERRASTYSQIVQGYLVFFFFIGIMLVIQLKLFPQFEQISQGLTSGLTTTGVLQGLMGEGKKANLDQVFFFMLMIQGFFTGIMIGKFSEGTLRQGILHSLALITIAALIVTTVKGGI